MIGLFWSLLAPGCKRYPGCFACGWQATDDRLCSSSLPAIPAAREGEETQKGSATVVQIQIIFFAPLARKKMSIDNESDQVS